MEKEIENKIRAQLKLVKRNLYCIHSLGKPCKQCMEKISGNVSRIYGDVSEISGDVSEISGDVSEISGDVSGIYSDVSGIIKVLSR